jgi:hypothetical protein
VPEHRISARRLQSEWRLNPNHYLAIDYHPVDPERPHCHDDLQQHSQFGYAFDKDEIRGLLTGGTPMSVATGVATIHSNIIGYVGGYYQ